MSERNQSIGVGDIVASYVPTFGHAGKPGEEFKNGLVLGLEVDPKDHAIVGVYICRLSSRTNLVRSWDFFVDRRTINRDGEIAENDFVLRTCRVDLLPYTEEYFGPETFVYGQIDAQELTHISRKMIRGQDSSFYTASWGPRAKRDDTVVMSSLGANDSYKDFRFEDMLGAAKAERPTITGASSNFAQQFEMAMRQLGDQTRQKARELHWAFLDTYRHSHQNTPFQP